jgi:dienelactone hydrolase
MRRVLLAVLLMLPGAARAERVTFPGPDGITLQAELLLPSGPVTGAAIVALHGCGGPFAVRDRQWSRVLTGAGHAVLFPDSFGSRGLASQCRVRDRVVTAGGLRRRDALAAAEWLAAQPGTPAGGVVVLGWSDGGSTVVATARAGQPDAKPGLIRGFVAFYPGCRPQRTASWRPFAPMLMLHGEADDWTPIAPCRALAEQSGGMVTQVGFPGAYHDFDAPTQVRIMRDIPSSQNPDKTVHAGGNPDARTAALLRVPAFIAALPKAAD